MTRPVLFLRVASVLVLIQSILHTIGGVFGKPAPGPGTVAWLAMNTNHFPVAGFDRSYADFYIGFGLCITTSLAIEGIVFWLLGNLARTNAVIIRPIVGVFFLGYLVFSLLSYFYFFPPPMIADLLISLCLVVAFFTAKPLSTA